MAFPNLQSLVSFVFNMVINNNFKTYPGLNPPLNRQGWKTWLLCDFLLEKVVVIRQESCLCVCVCAFFVRNGSLTNNPASRERRAPFLLGSAAIFVDLSFAVVLPPTIRGKEQKRGGTDGVGFYCWTSSTWQFCWWPIFGMVKTWPFQRLLVTSNVWWSKGHELNHQSPGRDVLPLEWDPPVMGINWMSTLPMPGICQNKKGLIKGLYINNHDPLIIRPYFLAGWHCVGLGPLDSHETVEVFPTSSDFTAKVAKTHLLFCDATLPETNIAP